MPPLHLLPTARFFFGILAEAGGGEAAPRPDGIVVLLQYLPLVAIVALAWMILYRPERQRQIEQQRLRENLRKNDRVVTAAGIYGTVANVDRDGDRVTLKVDESTNTRLEVTLASVLKVLGEPSGPTVESKEGSG
jgi:preprotein translocase subunit YajC